MTTLVEMPVEHHRQLMSNCSDPEHWEVLDSGVLLPARENDHSQMVVILCEPEQAKLIVELASRVYPEALQAIKQYTA